jgi:NAD(P)-dependent dehydrogenase (short-subunit alcohol dehydrogenase family)
MNRKLEDKVAGTTGADSGIGLATAKRFVGEGAYVRSAGLERQTKSRRQSYFSPRTTAAMSSVRNSSSTAASPRSELRD